MRLNYLKPLKDGSYTAGSGGYGYDFNPRDTRSALTRRKLSQDNKLTYEEMNRVLATVVKGR